MTTRRYSDERRWANTDPSMHFNGPNVRREHVPSWHGAHIYCLKMRDDEAAELIRSRNTVKRIYCGDRNRGCGAELTSADLEAGCCTQCHEPLVPEPLPLKHALLLSLSELQSQRDAA